MGSYESGATGNGWCGDGEAAPCSAADIDGLLAGAGYRVRSSDLHNVAQRLERLESAMVGGVGSGYFGSAAQLDQHLLASDAVHYNPSDLASWVESMLFEISPSSSSSAAAAPCQVDDLVAAPPILATGLSSTEQPLQSYPQHQQHVAAVQMMEEEEDSGIRLVHLLMTCGESVQRGDTALAGALIEEMRLMLARVGTRFGIGKVASYFIDALSRRLYTPPQAAAGSAVESEVLYHHFYESCPYLKFAHFTANQAILEAFDGRDRVHVVDFNLMHGLQWPALIQALALRPGGPPTLRLTGIGPPSPDGRDSLREVGMRLAELARSVGVRFTFRGVAASRLDDVRPWMLQVAPGETVAVNSVMQLHRLLGDPEADGAAAAPIYSVLGWIRGLRPKIVTVVEQEADHNKAAFLDRFTEALFYYSTMFDSLEGGGGVGVAQPQQMHQVGAAAAGVLGGERAVAEAYLQREICNIVCCEGAARVERHEPLTRWRGRMAGAGFRATHLGSNAFKQASMLLTLFSGEGYCVEEVDGCLTLGWHSHPLFSASAWRADGGDQDVAPSAPASDSNNSILINNNRDNNISSNNNNNINNINSNSSAGSTCGSNNNNNNNNAGSTSSCNCRQIRIR